MSVLEGWFTLVDICCLLSEAKLKQEMRRAFPLPGLSGSPLVSEGLEFLGKALLAVAVAPMSARGQSGK